ncbi:hypothetical protein BD94_1068 [Elizabethkingia anophelis NUHP1]|uniref:Uncharacterized protein n=1 Tax=Elizabethkingia anophelis NUHP1 TaxID=1338011 RepID=A0A077EE05_9FLAO|nr:hypothetical protein [Elizabethkingia sp. ASV34]AIL44843.1 hypothetical protein BD94_1068 [Elizabethkingia anophelis NUHP1]CDN72873.1 hypothetical protein E18064_110031 [Elizabethkingia anophelis]CDN78845.1 hypothetical protein E27107_330032 [Elizabethkingia anophelis]
MFSKTLPKPKVQISSVFTMKKLLMFYEFNDEHHENQSGYLQWYSYLCFF